MPQFVLNLGSSIAAQSFCALDEFTQAYIEAMFWTDTGPDYEDMGLDNRTFADLYPGALERIIADCRAFQDANAADLEDCDLSQAGHDFWLTRNGHGVGFSDRDDDTYGTPEARDRLDEAARKWRGVDGCELISERGEHEPEEGWIAYAATWGSAMHSGDPGACMYGYGEYFEMQSEAHRQDCIAWVERDCIPCVEKSPQDYESGELDTLKAFLEAIKAAPLAVDA